MNNSVLMSLPIFLLICTALILVKRTFSANRIVAFPQGLFFTSIFFKFISLFSGAFYSISIDSYPLALLSFSALIDLYIISFIQQDRLNKAFLYINFMIILFSISFSIFYVSIVHIGLAASIFSFLMIQFYQSSLINASWVFSVTEKKFLSFNSIFLSICLFSLLVHVVPFDIFLSQNILELLYKYNLAILCVLSFFQVGFLLKYFVLAMQEKKNKEKYFNKEYNILNIYGFVNNVGSIRRICSRLDQGVTLAVFKIENYDEIKNLMNGDDFVKFKRTVLEFLKFSLRKHDQLAILDDNIFVVLLPFTDFSKGKLACSRLSEQTRREIKHKGFILPHEFGFRFGLTSVGRREVDVLDAMTRAASALAEADPYGLAGQSLLDLDRAQA